MAWSFALLHVLSFLSLTNAAFYSKNSGVVICAAPCAFFPIPHQRRLLQQELRRDQCRRVQLRQARGGQRRRGGDGRVLRAVVWPLQATPTRVRQARQTTQEPRHYRRHRRLRRQEPRHCLALRRPGLSYAQSPRRHGRRHRLPTSTRCALHEEVSAEPITIVRDASDDQETARLPVQGRLAPSRVGILQIGQRLADCEALLCADEGPYEIWLAQKVGRERDRETVRPIDKGRLGADGVPARTVRGV